MLLRSSGIPEEPNEEGNRSMHAARLLRSTGPPGQWGSFIRDSRELVGLCCKRFKVPPEPLLYAQERKEG